MAFGPQEVQKTIFTILSTDATLQAALGGTLADPRVYDFVPQEKSYPYVTIEIGPVTDRGSTTTEGLALEPQINVWHRAPGNKPVQDLQKIIDGLLHNKDICIDGFDLIVMRRSLIDLLTDPDSVTRHGVQRFKLFIGEN